MRITKVEGISLKCACSPISDALSTSSARQALLVKVETDSALYGIGEAFTYGAPLAAMKALVEDELGVMLIGKDPSDIEGIWQIMYWRSLAHGRRGLVMGAISGIDIALWDLLGKSMHRPVSSLLGRQHSRIPSYASGGFYAAGKGPGELEKEIEGYLKKGYRDVKIKIGRNLERKNAPLRYMAQQANAVTEEEDYRRIALVKSLIGEGGRLFADANASWDLETALERGEELRRLGVCWLEEPLPFEELESYREVRKRLPELSVIGCETQQGEKNFETMVRGEALDIVQPDVGWAGGITECKRIGGMAERHGRKLSLHCFGSAVLFAASLHLASSMRNLERMESEENPNPLKESILKNPLEADEDMSFFVPEGEGLGIELDWEAVRRLQAAP